MRLYISPESFSPQLKQYFALSKSLFWPHEGQNLTLISQLSQKEYASQVTKLSNPVLATQMRAPQRFIFHLHQLILYAATRFMCSSSFYLQQLILFAATHICSNSYFTCGNSFSICSNSFFICSNSIYLQQLVLFAACPLWATVV